VYYDLSNTVNDEATIAEDFDFT